MIRVSACMSLTVNPLSSNWSSKRLIIEPDAELSTKSTALLRSVGLELLVSARWAGNGDFLPEINKTFNSFLTQFAAQKALSNEPYRVCAQDFCWRTLVSNCRTLLTLLFTHTIIWISHRRIEVALLAMITILNRILNRLIVMNHNAHLLWALGHLKSRFHSSISIHCSKCCRRLKGFFLTCTFKFSPTFTLLVKVLMQFSGSLNFALTFLVSAVAVCYRKFNDVKDVEVARVMNLCVIKGGCSEAPQRKPQCAARWSAGKKSIRKPLLGEAHVFKHISWLKTTFSNMHIFLLLAVYPSRWFGDTECRAKFILAVILDSVWVFRWQCLLVLVTFIPRKFLTHLRLQ